MAKDITTITKAQALELAGGAPEVRGAAMRLAEILGCSHQAVHAWPDNRIPDLALYKLRTLKPHWFRARTLARLKAK